MQLELDLDPGDARLFTDEAIEQIDRIEQGLLELERAEPSPVTVNDVFRAAHTLKGSAATIGHRRMAELTHAMENVFGALRSGTIGELGPFADTLLATIDVLRALVDEVSVRQTITDAPEELSHELRALLEEATSGPRPVDVPAPGEGTAAPDAQPAVDPVVAALLAIPAPLDGARCVIRCEVDEGSDWGAVRLLQALIEAEETGTLLGSEPSREVVEAGDAGRTMTMLVASALDETADLRTRLATVDELKVLSIEAVATSEAALPPQPAAPPTAVVPVGDAAPGPDAAAAASAPTRAPGRKHGRRAGTPGVAGVGPGGPGEERRQADLGVEARGLPTEERLAVAGDRIQAAQQTIRIDVSRLDELMNLVGELVVHKTRLMRQARDIGARLGDDPLARAAEESSQQFAFIASQLQDQVTRLRMLPIETVFNRFPRAIRDLAVKLEKEVDLVIEGKETELDRSVLEKVGDPLGHLLRNALDHGIEAPDEREAAGKPRRGTVRLGAHHADGQIVITVEDDGRGLDPAKLRASAVRKELLSESAAAALADQEAMNLVFMPGFSTASKVTDVSGRGVGLDVVRTNIESLGGRVQITSDLGKGSRFALSLPLTLAIVGALLVRSGSRICALPLTGVVETLRVQRTEIAQIRRHPALPLRGRVVPIEPLDSALGDPPRTLEASGKGFVYLVVVRSSGRELALAVDGFVGEQEIVLKSLGGVLGRLPGVAGATVMGDGTVALVIDIAALIDAQEARSRGAGMRRIA